MATFTINKDQSLSERTVEADRFAESGSFTIFYDVHDDQVFSIQTKQVSDITRE